MIIDYPIIIFYVFLVLSSVLMLKIKFYAAFPTAIDSDGTSNRYSQGESDTVGWFVSPGGDAEEAWAKRAQHENNKAGRTLG